MNANNSRILIIDDDQDFADGLAEMLDLYGHETRTAYTPDAGIAEAESTAFDFAMIDIGLPGRNGVVCAREIQQRREDIVCILMTGYSTDTLSKLGVRVGDVIMLRKPISPDDVTACLMR
jgi:ActR/RegA family two-component response regulator